MDTFYFKRKHFNILYSIGIPPHQIYILLPAISECWEAGFKCPLVPCRVLGSWSTIAMWRGSAAGVGLLMLAAPGTRASAPHQADVVTALQCYHPHTHSRWGAMQFCARYG